MWQSAQIATISPIKKPACVCISGLLRTMAKAMLAVDVVLTEPVSGARLGKRSSEFDGASCVLNSFQKYARVHARAIKKAKLGPLRSFLYQSACRANAIPFEITMCFAIFLF
jgi:hypothetical protein